MEKMKNVTQHLDPALPQVYCWSQINSGQWNMKKPLTRISKILINKTCASCGRVMTSLATSYCGHWTNDQQIIKILKFLADKNSAGAETDIV